MIIGGIVKQVKIKAYFSTFPVRKGGPGPCADAKVQTTSVKFFQLVCSRHSAFTVVKARTPTPTCKPKTNIMPP